MLIILGLFFLRVDYVEVVFLYDKIGFIDFLRDDFIGMIGEYSFI